MMWKNFDIVYFYFLRQNSQYIDEDEKKNSTKKDTYARWLKFAGMCSCVLSRMDSMIDSQTIRWLGIITLADSYGIFKVAIACIWCYAYIYPAKDRSIN